MKRTITIFLTLVLTLSFMVIPASAAETAYSFPGFSTPDGMFQNFGVSGFESGMYNIWIVDNGSSEKVGWTSEPVALDFGGEYLTGSIRDVWVTPSGDNSLVVSYQFYEDGYGTIAVDYGDSAAWSGGGLYGDGYTLYLEPVPSESSPVPSIQEFVTPDALSMVLDEVVSLIPTVLVVIVSYLAIRKGIAYLTESLHKS